MNLYREIVEDLKRYNKTIEDIRWVGTVEATIPTEKFLEDSKFIDYDAGYGGAEIAQDLIVVGDNWWLERHEYDGSEWFEFKQTPIKPNIEKTEYWIDKQCWGGLFEKPYGIDEDEE